MSGDVHVGLWLTVIALGVYHGLSPTMGWPLAVANGLAAKRGAAVFATGWPLGAGHFAAMAIVLVPFALLAWYVEWSRAIRVVAAAAVVLFGVYRLLDRRHPRFLARVRPTHVGWWSLLIATAHGAGLMLVPFAFGLCTSTFAIGGSPASGPSHTALMQSLGASVAIAVIVSIVHTLAMLGAGLAVAWLVYRYLGLRFLTRAWLDLDTLWGASLVITGAASLALALAAS
jgi:hypothetical protein